MKHEEQVAPESERFIVSQFVKRYIHIPGRPAVPAVEAGPTESVMVELASGKRIPSQFQDMISLRETNPDGPNAGQTYLTISHENKKFTTLRFDAVPGLDFDPETGALLTLQDLEQRRAADIEARQAANLARVATESVDLDEIEA